MATETTETTLAEQKATYGVQVKIPRPTWDRMKIQAIREKLTAEQLAAKAFDSYLSANEPN